MEARCFTLTLPYIPARNAWPRAFEGRTWRARAATKGHMKQDVASLVKGSQGIQLRMNGRPFERAHITLTFQSPRGNYDLDNALSASKGWIDGLVAAGAIQNDTALRVSYSVYWERAEQESTTIEVQEVV